MPIRLRRGRLLAKKPMASNPPDDKGNFLSAKNFWVTLFVWRAEVKWVSPFVWRAFDNGCLCLFGRAIFGWVSLLVWRA